MPYQTGTANTQEDLVTAFVNFAVANGYTQNELSSGNRRAVISRGNLFMGFRWSAVGASGAIGLYQSTGYTGGNNVGAHPGDSGCGVVTTGAVTSERRLDIGDGPYVAYHFFADSATANYIHAVVEVSAGLFVHFGCGNIDKVGDWVGGEYVAGMLWPTNTDITTISTNYILLDGATTHSTTAQADEKSTMRIQGMPNQSGGMTWAIFSASSSPLGTDTAGNNRINLVGGSRGASNPDARAMGWIRANPASGFVPLFRIPIWLQNLSSSPNDCMLLGYVRDMRIMQMANFSPGEEFTVGSDTWKVFPGVRKQTGGTGSRSRNFGIAYRKIP